MPFAGVRNYLDWSKDDILDFLRAFNRERRS